MSEQTEKPPREWGAGKTSRGRARLPSSRRRDKPQLSCNFCKRMKVRCDRLSPCSTCQKRGLGSSCTYASLNTPSSCDKPTAPKPPVTVQERIRQLESLVLELMQQTTESSRTSSEKSDQRLRLPTLNPRHDANQSPSAPTDDCPTEDAGTPPANVGSMQKTRSGASYVSAVHWATVLDGISELKDHFHEVEKEAWPQIQKTARPLAVDLSGPQLLSGCGVLPTRAEILAAIPPRPVADLLISRFFDLFDMSPAVLHSAEFLNEYEDFWADPSTTSLIWLGLLFTMMCLAAQAQKYHSDPDNGYFQSTLSLQHDYEKMVETFRPKIAQCLTLGNYTRGGPYVLETLMLYIAIELFVCKDAEIGIWILLGTMVQLAMHMGYHRDPKHFKEMTPFEGEMRKRVWATAVDLDLGISMQMGLPRLIKQWQADTQAPSNLFDSDLDKEIKDIPPSRPDSTLTPMLFRLVKSRFMTTVGMIWNFAADVRSYPYTEIMKMDTKLQDARASIPKCLKWQSIGGCILDPPRIILQKVSLESIFHKARIVLHRKFLYCLLTDAQYAYSRKECVDSALQLLELQQMLSRETQPDCRLHEQGWKVSSLLNGYFLLATSVLCFYLRQVRHKVHPETDESEVNRIRQSLKESHNIWLRSRKSSKEAHKVAEALSVVLGDCAASETNKDINANLPTPPTEMPISPVCNGANSHNPGSVASFESQFTVFDVNTSPSWASLTGEVSGSMPWLMSNPEMRSQNMDGVTDMFGIFQWPWSM
ncbi:hypothetical protein F5Y16DRAFT_63898 [Xylariaceae sp. FL0255]|nr:hypothetical protein F5Y16DRAFT_63898 [Xylariaceae sp. FL0255]